MTKLEEILAHALWFKAQNESLDIDDVVKRIATRYEPEVAAAQGEPTDNLVKALESKAGLDEADAYMFPSDLRDFQSREMGAMAHSIRLMRPEEDTTALFSIDSIRKAIAAENTND